MAGHGAVLLSGSGCCQPAAVPQCLPGPAAADRLAGHRGTDRMAGRGPPGRAGYGQVSRARARI